MVILGLGSNVGDRLANLRKALYAIKKIAKFQVLQVSPVYVSDALLPENAPPEWDMPHLNLALRCATSLAPLDLLKTLKEIEWSIGRKPEIRHWGPRILDIDILAYNDEVIKSDTLTVPHQHLVERPFALWPLTDVAPHWRFPLAGEYEGKTAAQIADKWESRFNGKAPFRTRQISQRIDTPRLIGILNITPDSFSDGGLFDAPAKAISQARALVNAGAEIIDIGAESTAPSATLVSPKEEWQRLQPILSAIKQAMPEFFLKPLISIDTRRVETAEKALAEGIDWINDVTGLSDRKMRELVIKADVDCVVMHHLSIPASGKVILPRQEDAIKSLHEWALNQIDILERAGLKHERLILDPGIGFGKSREHSLALIQHINVFKDLGTRLLIGHSRKSFLSLFTDHHASERDIETAVMSLFLANQQIDYLRVHNVEITARAFRTYAALTPFA